MITLLMGGLTIRIELMIKQISIINKTLIEREVYIQVKACKIYQFQNWGICFL